MGVTARDSRDILPTYVAMYQPSRSEHIQGRAGWLVDSHTRTHSGSYRLFHRLAADRATVNATVAEVNLELGRTWKRALDYGFRKRVLDILLQRPAERPRAVA